MRHALRISATTFLLVALAPVSVAWAQVAAGGVYTIQSVHSGKILDLRNGVIDNGNAVVQNRGSHAVTQQFVLVDAGGGYFAIQSVPGGRMLDVSGGSTEGGAAVILWPSHGGDNQKFRLQPAGGGAYHLVAKHSNLALDVSGASTADGAAIIQWPLHGGPNQKFYLVPLGGAPPQPPPSLALIPTPAPAIGQAVAHVAQSTPAVPPPPPIPLFYRPAPAPASRPAPPAPAPAPAPVRSFADVEEMGLYIVQQYAGAIRDGLGVVKELAARDPYFRSAQFREDTRNGRFDQVARRMNIPQVANRMQQAMRSVPIFIPQAWSLGVSGGATFIAGGTVEGGGVWDFADLAHPLGYLTYSYEFGFAMGGNVALSMGLWVRPAARIGGNADAVTIKRIGGQYGIDFALWLDPSKYVGNRLTLDSVVGFIFSPGVEIGTREVSEHATGMITKKLAEQNKAWAVERARTHLYRDGHEVPPILPNLIDPRTVLTAVGTATIQGATVVGKGVIQAGNAVGQGATQAGAVIGKGATQAANTVGKGATQAANTVGKGATSAAKEVGKGATSAAKDVTNFFGGKDKKKKK